MLRPIQERRRRIYRTPGVKLIGTLYDFHEFRTTVGVTSSCMYAKRNNSGIGRELQQCQMQKEGIPASDFASVNVSTTVPDDAPSNTEPTADVCYSLTLCLGSRLPKVHKESGRLESLLDGKPQECRRVDSAAR